MTTHGIGKWYIELQKQGFWRGNPHTWVNRYVMTGADPTSSDAITVISALHDIEEQLHAQKGAASGVGFVQGRAYASTGYSAFASVNYNVSQAAATATGFTGATWTDTTQSEANTLEVCMLLETPLLGLSSSGKPLTLRKFYRGAFYGGVEPDDAAGIPAADIAGIKAVTLPMFTGLGGTAYTVTSPNPLRVPALAPRPLDFICNRQIPKGRKKKITVKTSNGTVVSIKKFGSPDGDLGDLDDLPSLP